MFSWCTNNDSEKKKKKTPWKKDRTLKLFMIFEIGLKIEVRDVGGDPYSTKR